MSKCTRHPYTFDKNCNHCFDHMIKELNYLSSENRYLTKKNDDLKNTNSNLQNDKNIILNLQAENERIKREITELQRIISQMRQRLRHANVTIDPDDFESIKRNFACAKHMYLVHGCLFQDCELIHYEMYKGININKCYYEFAYGICVKPGCKFIHKNKNERKIDTNDNFKADPCIYTENERKINTNNEPKIKRYFDTDNILKVEPSIKKENKTESSIDKEKLAMYVDNYLMLFK